MNRTLNNGTTEDLFSDLFRNDDAISGDASCSKLKKTVQSLGDMIANQPANSEERVKSPLRVAPANDDQPDFFVPSLCDISIKDGIGLMDVAVFRLARNQRRKGDMIRHELPGAIIEVTSSAYGMATIEDYDLVLMAISHLAAATRDYKAGRGPKPSRTFRPHAVDIFKFRRRRRGGKQYKELEGTLDRLKTTSIKIVRTDDRSKLRESDGFGLLQGYRVTSRTDTGRLASVEMTIPEWIYQSVINHEKPEVLTIDPDYFLLTSGLARFVYRLARKAAGYGKARFLFSTVHARSGSTRSIGGFTDDLREIIATNRLPGYTLFEERAREGSVLVMSARPKSISAPIIA